MKTRQTEKYRQELYDARWRTLRTRILERDGYKCRSCGRHTGLQVHHRQYHREGKTGEWKKPWEYQTWLLVTLCDSCHREGHRIYAIPIKDI